MEQTDTDRIEARAYALWEEAGRPDGDAERFWYQAEREAGAQPDATAAEEFASDVASGQGPEEEPAAKPARKPRKKE